MASGEGGEPVLRNARNVEAFLLLFQGSRVGERKWDLPDHVGEEGATGDDHGTAALPEDLGSGPSIHMVAHHHL